MSKSYFNDKDADTMQPSEEQVLQNKIRELTGLDPQALEDEQGKPLPGITPESVESNRQGIINAIGDLKKLTEKRADSEKQAKLAEDIAAAIDPTKPAENVLHAIQRIEGTLTEPLQPTPVLQEALSREETDAYEPEFLIDNWMPANRLALLTGSGGTGKSYFALQHVCGLAMGITDYFLKPYHGTTDQLYSEYLGRFPQGPHQSGDCFLRGRSLRDMETYRLDM